MAGLADLKRIDVSEADVLTVTSGQGSEVTFSLENFDRQLLRWQRVFEECRRYNKTIATLDLAVSENTPLRMQEASIMPPSPPKAAKPQRAKKRNV